MLKKNYKLRRSTFFILPEANSLNIHTLIRSDIPHLHYRYIRSYLFLFNTIYFICVIFSVLRSSGNALRSHASHTLLYMSGSNVPYTLSYKLFPYMDALGLRLKTSYRSPRSSGFLYIPNIHSNA